MTEFEDRVRGAYADLHLAVPESTLPYLALRRRRRLAVLGAAAAALTVVAGAGVALGAGPPAPPVATSPTGDPAPPARLDVARYVLAGDPPWLAACLEGARGMGGEVPGVDPSEVGGVHFMESFEPETGFHFADGRLWFSFLLTEQAAAGCWGPLGGRPNRPGTTSDEPFTGLLSFNEHGRDPGWLPEGALPSFRHFAHSGGGDDWSLVAGDAPPGTERVEILLDDGTVVSAVLSGGWFVAWLPGASGFTFRDTIVEVAAYTPDAVHVRRGDQVTTRLPEPAG